MSTAQLEQIKVALAAIIVPNGETSVTLKASEYLKLLEVIKSQAIALDAIIKEPYQTKWRENEDGTRTNLFAAWAREFADKNLEQAAAILSGGSNE